MTERQIIEDRLRKKVAEIQSLEEKVRAARIYVQALQDVLKLMGGKSESAHSTESALRPGSSVAKAREAILARKEAMHINDILDALGIEVTRDSRASLTSSLSAYVRREEMFTRPAPSTFGLVELGHYTVAEPPTEPPKGFGTVTGPGYGTGQGFTPSGPDLDDEIPF